MWRSVGFVEVRGGLWQYVWGLGRFVGVCSGGIWWFVVVYGQFVVACVGLWGGL